MFLVCSMCACMVYVEIVQGKFIRVNFDNSAHIVGASIDTCILHFCTTYICWDVLGNWLLLDLNQIC